MEYYKKPPSVALVFFLLYLSKCKLLINVENNSDAIYQR